MPTSTPMRLIENSPLRRPEAGLSVGVLPLRAISMLAAAEIFNSVPNRVGVLTITVLR